MIDSSRTDALQSLSVALGEFLASGESSDPTEYDPESLDIEACEPDGYLHDAVKEVERHYGGKLPAPTVRNAWRGLLRAVRSESTDSHDRQTVAHECAGKLLTWAEEELSGKPVEPDGPCGINQWRIDGRILKGELSGKPGKIAAYLFGRIGRKCRISDVIDELSLGRVQDDAVRKNGSKAAAWFMDRNTPFLVETGDGHIWMRDGRKTDE